MLKRQLLKCAALSVALGVTACSSSDTDSDPAPDASMFNPDLPDTEDSGNSGGDTTAIAGLWDGTTAVDNVNDVVYWNLAANGVLTRYDYQQDGVATASGENCYIVGEPISVTPEDGSDYSLFNVAVTAVRTDDSLSITFNEADKNDVDQDDDVTESPTFDWTLLTTPVLADLNSCTLAAQGPEGVISADLSVPSTPEPDYIPQPMDAVKPSLTQAACAASGGTVVFDIGDGTMFQPEYRCDSGLAPSAYITFLEGEPIAVEGAVCCV